MNSRLSAARISLARRRARVFGVLAASLLAGSSVPAQPPTRPMRLPSVAPPETGTATDTYARRWTTAGIERYARFTGKGDRKTALQTPAPATTAAEQPTDEPPKPRFEETPIVVKPASVKVSEERELAARWLRSTTSTAALEVSRRLLHQASGEYNVGAWLSAETSAWDALRYAAEAVDLADRERGVPALSIESAQARLQFARTAIDEARDFSGIYGALDGDAIARMARSHRTNVLDDQSTDRLTETDASDRYLDEARVALAPIASRSVEAAQTMDLLAAIYLSRAETGTLPSATALCLRRAALQGQPGNASLASRLGMHLADLGLYEEARWALEHSLSIEPDPAASETLARVLRRSGHGEDAARVIADLRNGTERGGLAAGPRIPEITELSPADFAALSKPVTPIPPANHDSPFSLASRMRDSGQTADPSAAAGTKVTGATYRQPAAAAAVVDVNDEQPNEKPGMVRRLMNSLKRAW